MYTDYISNDQLLGDEENTYLGYNIKTKIIYGYIYRGDLHDNIMLSSKPKFYGPRQSAEKYIAESTFLKRYTTVKKIRLLNFSNHFGDTQNENILNFFRNYVLKNTKPSEIVDVKIIIIMMQALFGIVVNGEIDTQNLSNNDIISYLKKNNFIEFHVNLFMKIINVIIKQSIPSRCSVRQFDKFFMIKLRNVLIPFEIEGIYYVKNKKLPNVVGHIEKELCSFVNNEYIKKVNTCVPTEMCIFYPKKVLGGVKIWKRTGKKFIEFKIKKKFNKYIRKNYNRLSIDDLEYMGKMYYANDVKV